MPSLQVYFNSQLKRNYRTFKAQGLFNERKHVLSFENQLVYEVYLQSKFTCKLLDSIAFCVKLKSDIGVALAVLIDDNCLLTLMRYK